MPAGPARTGVPPLPKVDSLFSERLAAGAARRLAPRCSARKPRNPAPFARRSLFSERLAAGAARRLAPRCSARKARNPAPFARRSLDIWKRARPGWRRCGRGRRRLLSVGQLAQIDAQLSGLVAQNRDLAGLRRAEGISELDLVGSNGHREP